ncbi:MAG: hypothetical protein WCF65_06425 [Parachlamydiaceae bacterium]
MENRDDKNIDQLRAVYTQSRRLEPLVEKKDLKKAMREAKNSFEKMKKVQEQLHQAYADISQSEK